MRCELHVFDREFAWQGIVGEYDGLRATRAHLAVSDAEFTAPSDLDVRPVLAAPGSRLAVMLDGEQFVGGLVTVSGRLAPGSDIGVQVEDDYGLVGRVLGWSVPGSALNAQTVSYWRTSPAKRPAETAVKAVLSANIARLGLPWTVAPDLGRGGLVELSYRFHPLTSRWTDWVRQAGLGISVTLVEGAGLLIDVYEATAHALPLTYEDGVILDGEYEVQRPTASRAVGGAQGEATSRVFFGPYVDTAREALFGFCGELFVDARDTDDSTTVTDRLALAVAEAGPKVSVSMTLAESADFSYGAYRVGDVVPVEYQPGVTPTTDVLTEATLTHSAAVPEPEVTFQLGERADDGSMRTWRSIAAVASGVHDLRSAR